MAYYYKKKKNYGYRRRRSNYGYRKNWRYY